MFSLGVTCAFDSSSLHFWFLGQIGLVKVVSKENEVRRVHGEMNILALVTSSAGDPFPCKYVALLFAKPLRVSYLRALGWAISKKIY